MIEQISRRTKVIKSFEGKALTAKEAEAVGHEDCDVLRLVYEAKLVPQIKEFIRTIAARDAKKAERPRQPLMLDVASYTQGTIFGLKQARDVAFGERIVLVPSTVPAPPGAIQVKAEDAWGKLFVDDAKVYIGSGNVALRTVSARGDRVELDAAQGGTIHPEMDVIIPETRKDPERNKTTTQELKELIKEGVDYLIVPGQWTADRIEKFRSALVADHGDNAPWLIGKVDSGAVYERLEDLVKHVDGILISRREMSLTLNPATLPMITKEIIQLCNDSAKVVVTASEMLASMRRNVTPTRAEVSDVANAVIDGTDAVMLSEEVANGKFGAKAVDTMARIVCDIEGRTTNVRPNWIKHAPTIANEMDAVAYHALRTAERIQAKAIVTITKAGNTALKLASFRAPVPIIAVTFSKAVERRLSIVRGVDTLHLDVNPNIDEVLPLVNEQLTRSSWLKPGDSIIFVAITLSPVGRESSNLFTVQTLT